MCQYCNVRLCVVLHRSERERERERERARERERGGGRLWNMGAKNSQFREANLATRGHAYHCKP